MVEPGFIFEPSQPDPGLPEGVFDPSDTEQVRESQRAPETQESVEFVTRPRDESPNIIEQEQLAPSPSPSIIVSQPPPQTLADTDVLLQTSFLDSIAKDRPRDDVADALAAIDLASELGGVEGDFAVITAAEALPLQFLPVEPSALFTGMLTAADKEPTAFDKSLQAVGIDPERAKTAIQTVAIGAGLLIVAPIVIRGIGNIFGAFQKARAGA